MSKSKKPKNKFLVGLFVVISLIVLFFASFWITSLTLRVGQEPKPIETGSTIEASATPDVDYKKLSRKELIALLEKRDDRIEELEEALGFNNALATQAPIDNLSSSTSSVPVEPAKPEPTKAPVATKAPEAKPAATQKPSATKAPAPKPTAAPAPKPTVAPAPKPTEAPAATKAPSIKPVAPAADSE